LIAQAPPVAGPYGEVGNKHISNELADLLKAGKSLATYQTAQTADAVMRTYSFRRVSGWPFTLAVGLVDEEFLAPWKIQAMWVSALLAMFFLGTAVFVRTSVRHLRARSAMEKAHTEDMRRWRILIEQSRDGIVVLDQQGKVVEVNQYFAEMLGYSVEEAQQLHVWDWDTTWSREELLTMMAQVDASGAQFATHHRRKDGEIIDVEISTNGTFYAGQKLIFCVCRDITERNLAEQTIREKEQLLRTLINSTPDLICFKDGKGRWLEANDADLHLFSLTGMNYKGKTDAELAKMTPPIYRESFLACEVSDEQSWQAGIVTRGEEIVTRVDGTRKTYDVLKSPIFEADGSRKGLVVLARDITEQKQLEEEKKGLVKQLIQAQKMEAIGTLAGGIADDFNNILGAIIGYSEMIHDDHAKDSPTALYIVQVLKAAERAKDLVKQILAFSRQSEADKRPVQPAVIVNEAVKLLRASLPSTIAIEKDVDSEVGFIMADPTQLHQIVMNLCTNAFHAMERNGGVLNVSLRKKEMASGDLNNSPHLQPGNYAGLLINDTGEGIPPELLDKIFNPFFTTKEVGKGTGMGLAMVHGIVQSSGGTITCHSRLGNGTTFEILLPTVEAGSEQATAAADILPRGKEHILFIDDEEMLVEMGKTMLERLGYRVTTSTDSMEALLAFEKMPESFDLVITDQTMPKMTGLELARRLLQIRPDIPVILCTGYSNVLSEDITKSSGIRGFAMKPLARADVAKLVRQLLDEAKECGGKR
jgi:PAS domain S-box-containing protein